eukprot:8015874-Karenia_brevis.AAC.1
MDLRSDSMATRVGMTTRAVGVSGDEKAKCIDYFTRDVPRDHRRRGQPGFEPKCPPPIPTGPIS